MKGNRTKRISLAVDPATFEQVAAAAQINRQTFNGMINQILGEYCQRHSAAIEEFTSARAKAQSSLFDSAAEDAG